MQFIRLNSQHTACIKMLLCTYISSSHCRLPLQLNNKFKSNLERNNIKNLLCPDSQARAHRPSTNKLTNKLSHITHMAMMAASTCGSLYTYIFTSQDFSWLQNGQLNWLSKGSFLFLEGAFRFDLRLPILIQYRLSSRNYKMAAKPRHANLIPGF
jgi:hypothetical protein